MKIKLNSDMKILRRKIVVYFLVITFVAMIISSIIDGVLEYLVLNVVDSETVVLDAETLDGEILEGEVLDNEAGIIALISSSLFLNIGVYVIGGFIFYLLTKREIKKERDRQINEQNLLYAAIAHDLKTPMTSVQGYAKALADGRIKEEEKDEIYSIIFNKSKSMDSLVDTLFEYSKFGTKEYKLNIKKLSLSVLVRDIIAELYCDFEEHDISIDIDIPEEVIEIKADKNELKRAITNLITNTYKHNPSGIKVLVRLHQYENNVSELIIADSGNPIPKDMNVFEPFVTENEARSIGQGTGLGLAITKKIIDEHKAKICIREDVPEYTKAFVVTFYDA
ncbi:MAG: HAMP domain-containing histidine kinase [Clostridia bacterium]|nr:HAMP domain-containing histidine kinase [Clostridia bacterium]